MAFQLYVAFVAVDVFGDERAARGPRGQDAEVAAESAPFGEVVCNVEGWGRGGSVFVVNERDSFDGVVRGCGGVIRGVRVDDYVAGEEVAMTEDELVGALAKRRLMWRVGEEKAYAVFTQTRGIAEFGDCAFELFLEYGLSFVFGVVGGWEGENPFLHYRPEIWRGLPGVDCVDRC